MESTIIEDLMLLGMGIMSDVGRSVESKGVGMGQDSGTRRVRMELVIFGEMKLMGQMKEQTIQKKNPKKT